MNSIIDYAEYRRCSRSVVIVERQVRVAALQLPSIMPRDQHRCFLDAGTPTRKHSDHTQTSNTPSSPSIIINTSLIIKQLRSHQPLCSHATHRFTLPSLRGSRDPKDLRTSISNSSGHRAIRQEFCFCVVSHGVQREEASSMGLTCERPFEMVRCVDGDGCS
jgi:hypothetical protein